MRVIYIFIDLETYIKNQTMLYWEYCLHIWIVYNQELSVITNVCIRCTVREFPITVHIELLNDEGIDIFNCVFLCVMSLAFN